MGRVTLGKIAGAAYAVAAVATFGHAAAGSNAYNEAYLAACQQRIADGIPAGSKCESYILTPATMSGLAAAAFWPLYWSWTVSEERAR
jgi:hypothetical protein